jgi:hypothetical protein
VKNSKPVLLPGTQNGFDFIRVDTAANRLLLGHEGTNHSMSLIPAPASC